MQGAVGPRQSGGDGDTGEEEEEEEEEEETGEEAEDEGRVDAQEGTASSFKIEKSAKVTHSSRVEEVPKEESHRV